MNQLGIVVSNRLTKSLETDIRSNIQVNTEISVVGSLDGLTDDDLRKMDTGGDSLYFENLNDGSRVYLPKNFIDGTCVKAAQKLNAQGIDKTMVYCTLPLPATHSFGVITPYDIITHAVISLNVNKIGIIVPLEEELNEEELRPWHDMGVGIIADFFPTLHEYSCETASVPETMRNAPDSYLVKIARSLLKQGAELFLLECMDYKAHHKKLIQQNTGKPVILPSEYISTMFNCVYPSD